MNSYTVNVDTKIFIFPKKIAHKAKPKKTKKSVNQEVTSTSQKDKDGMLNVI